MCAHLGGPFASGRLPVDSLAAGFLAVISSADAVSLVRLARSVLADQAATKPVGQAVRGHGKALANVTVHVERRLRACMSGRGDTLGDAVRLAAVRAAADTRYGPRLSAAELPGARVDVWIQTASHVICVADVVREIDLGLHGVEISCNGRSAYYTPSVALTHGVTRHERLLDKLAEKAGLATGAWRDPRATVRRTAWEHYCEVPGDPRRVQRLRRLRPADLSELTPATLRAHADLAADRLMRVQQRDGYYLYRFHPFTNRQTPGPGNLVRQAGCAYAMAQAADTAASPGRRDDLAASASGVIDALLSCAVVEAGALFIPDPPEDGAPVRGKLGTLALTLAALQCPSLAARYQAERRRLVATILSWQRPDGSFRCSTDSTGAADDGSAQDYFPGQALVALAAEMRTGDSNAQRAMAAALPWYAARFQAQPTTAFVPWQIQAWAPYAELAREASLEPDATAASDFVFRMADWMVQRQLLPGAAHCDMIGGYPGSEGKPGFSTTTYTQAIISAYQLARQLADEGRTNRYRTASLFGLEFMRRLQVSPDTAHLYIHPARTIGGTTKSLTSMTIRCDHDQHALTAYLDALKAADLLGPKDRMCIGGLPGSSHHSRARSRRSDGGNGSRMTCAVSVVIACHNEADNLQWTVDSFLGTLPEKSEVIIVDDHSDDGGTGFLESENHYPVPVRLIRPPARLGAAGARSFGADNARGEFLVFSDAHVKVSPGWTESICDALRNPAVGAVSPVISDLSKPERKGFGRTWQGEALDWQWLPKESEEAYPVPLLPGCFLATRRDVVNCAGGFDRGFHLWGSEGAELSLRLWLLGYECLLLPDVEAAHLFRGRRPYSIGWESVFHNTMRMAVLHFSAPRVARLISSLADKNSFAEAFTHLMSGDAWRKREHFRAVRVHDDDWFFDRFKIDCLS